MNIKAGVFKDFQVILLSHSLLTSFKDFRKLNMEQFLRVWENFTPPLGNSTINFCPGAGNQTKKLPGWPGLARSKNFFQGSPGGCTQLELTETLDDRVTGFDLSFLIIRIIIMLPS